MKCGERVDVYGANAWGSLYLYIVYVCVCILSIIYCLYRLRICEYWAEAIAPPTTRRAGLRPVVSALYRVRLPKLIRDGCVCVTKRFH